MTFFKSRMDKLRDRMNRHGMRQISVWVPKESANWLREIFSRVGEKTIEGHLFRVFLVPLLSKRRAPGQRYSASFLDCEIDGNSIGVGNEIAPIGGRIYNRTDTLIELSPIEARELKNELEEATGRILTNFIKKNSLSGKIRNTTGVLKDKHFLSNVELDTMSDEAFERSESRTIQDFVEWVFARGEPIIQDETIYKFLGFWNSPSRCQIVEDQTPDGHLFVAFIHIRYGGTSPTNMIEHLCDEIKRIRFPDVPLDKITWLDVHTDKIARPRSWDSPDMIHGKCWEMNAPHIHQVTYEESGFSSPRWAKPEHLPENTKTKIVDAIRRRIDKEAQAHFEVLNRERTSGEVQQPPLHFVMPHEIRKGYGNYYVDILIDASPEVRLVIALIPASPAGMGRETEPLLVFSKPGTLDFRSQPETDNLAVHWVCLSQLLKKETYSWNDEDFQEVCKLANINWEQAKEEFEGKVKSLQ